MVFRTELTYHEVAEILDTKYNDAKSTGYTLPPGIYKVSVINLIQKSLLLDDVNVNITIDDIKLRSNLTANKTIRLTEKSFFYSTFGFIQSHSGPLGDIERFSLILSRYL